MTLQEKVKEFLLRVKEGYHPSDLAELIEDLTDQQKKELFDLLSDEDAALILQEMEEIDQVTLFRLLTKTRASAVLKEMASDEAADLLGELPPDEAREILDLIEENAEEIEGLLRFPEESAGGIMTTEFIALPENIPAEEAITRLREIAPEAEIIYYVYVVDEETRLSGVLSLRDLISASDGTLLQEIMNPNVISVNAMMDQEEVARVVSRYDLLAVPVVDEQNRLLGIITVDDIIDVIEQEASEDIYLMAGTGDVEGVDLMNVSVFSIAKIRLPWLIISLLGGLLSGSVIGHFESTLQTIVLLAVFIPAIMDMGGNVGTQSSTVFVRGLATGELKQEQAWQYFLKEIRVGLTMGAVCGLLIASAAVIWKGVPILGLAVGIAMFTTVTLAAIIGTLVPLLFSRLGIDPAIAAGPFVTTIKDITGLLIYFWVATLFLPYLS
ncbi:MAG: magnesium transporter [Firmicutes bacterium]|nr:magnesium transporter [Bacillota bacterium]